MTYVQVKATPLYSESPQFRTFEMQKPCFNGRCVQVRIAFLLQPCIITLELWTPYCSVKWTGFSAPLVPDIQVDTHMSLWKTVHQYYMSITGDYSSIEHVLASGWPSLPTCSKEALHHSYSSTARVHNSRSISEGFKIWTPLFWTSTYGACFRGVNYVSKTLVHTVYPFSHHFFSLSPHV